MRHLKIYKSVFIYMTIQCCKMLLDHCAYFKVLGRGTFGKVVLCREKKNQVLQITSVHFEPLLFCFIHLSWYRSSMLFECFCIVCLRQLLHIRLNILWQTTNVSLSSFGRFSEAVCDEDFAQGGDRESGRGKNSVLVSVSSWSRWSTQWQRRECWRAARTLSSSVWGHHQPASTYYHHHN